MSRPSDASVSEQPDALADITATQPPARETQAILQDTDDELDIEEVLEQGADANTVPLVGTAAVQEVVGSPVASGETEDQEHDSAAEVVPADATSPLPEQGDAIPETQTGAGDGGSQPPGEKVLPSEEPEDEGKTELAESQVATDSVVTNQTELPTSGRLVVTERPERPDSGDTATDRASADTLGTDTNTSEIEFYGAFEVRDMLGGLNRGSFAKIARQGLLLTQRIRSETGSSEKQGRPEGTYNSKFAAPYVDAVVQYMEITGKEGTDALRDVAYGSGLQVQAMIDTFYKDAEELRRSDGTLSSEDACRLLGWSNRPRTLDAHFSGREPYLEDVLEKVEWVHTTLNDAEFLTTAQAVGDEVDIFRQDLWEAAVRGEVLAQRLVAGHEARAGGDYRYPRLALQYEKDYARNHGLTFLENIRGTHKNKGHTRDKVHRLVYARFNNSLLRAANPEGYIPVERAARLVGLTRTALQAYGLHENGRGIHIDVLHDSIKWNRPLREEPPLPPNVFDRRYNPFNR